jgi:hypothetical protein
MLRKSPNSRAAWWEVKSDSEGESSTDAGTTGDNDDETADAVDKPAAGKAAAKKKAQRGKAKKEAKSADKKGGENKAAKELEKKQTEAKKIWESTLEKNIEKFSDAALSLVEDLLKMPEGKLVASRSKKQGLKWLDQLRAAQACGGDEEGGIMAEAIILEVIDIEAEAGEKDGAVAKKGEKDSRASKMVVSKAKASSASSATKSAKPKDGKDKNVEKKENKTDEKAATTSKSSIPSLKKQISFSTPRSFALTLMDRENGELRNLVVHEDEVPGNTIDRMNEDFQNGESLLVKVVGEKVMGLVENSGGEDS